MSADRTASALTFLSLPPPLAPQQLTVQGLTNAAALAATETSAKVSQPPGCVDHPLAQDLWRRRSAMGASTFNALEIVKSSAWTDSPADPFVEHAGAFPQSPNRCGGSAGSGRGRTHACINGASSALFDVASRDGDVIVAVS